MKAWIDFKELRSRLSFEKVLERYGVEVKRKDNQHHGYCPLPNHNGKRNSPSFSANLERGIFQCFGCGAKGNILDFAALMEKADPKDGEALRRITLELQKRFFGVEPAAPKEKKPEPKPRTELFAIVNAPLDFELKELEPEHPYLFGRGFTQRIIEHFGLGFCSRGMLKGRIAIPLHDANGKLVGYAGRVVDDSTITQAYLTTFAEATTDPFGCVWLTPAAYRDAVKGTSHGCRACAGGAAILQPTRPGNARRATRAQMRAPLLISTNRNEFKRRFCVSG